MVKNTVLDFLSRKDIQKMLEKDDFDSVYNATDATEGGFRYVNDVSELTELFYAANVDPLRYLHKIPYGFLTNAAVEAVTLGPNVEIISVGSFSNCNNLRRLFIESPHSIAVYWNAFTFCPNLKDIDYIGTCDDWVKKVDVKSQNNAILQCTIHCRDGNLKWNSSKGQWKRI